MSIRKKVVFCKNKHKTNEKPHETKTNPTQNCKKECWFLLTFEVEKSIISLYENMMGFCIMRKEKKEMFNTTDIPKSSRITRLVDHLFENMPVIESARAKLITESYKETE